MRKNVYCLPFTVYRLAVNSYNELKNSFFCENNCQFTCTIQEFFVNLQCS